MATNTLTSNVKMMKIGRAYLLKKSVQHPITMLRMISKTLKAMTAPIDPKVFLNPGLL